jgi:Enoyl-(Acyl carrier protein) reductase
VKRIARNPLCRPGTPEELAAGILFLWSPGASYPNGHLLTIDGGLTLTGGDHRIEAVGVASGCRPDLISRPLQQENRSPGARRSHRSHPSKTGASIRRSL